MIGITGATGFMGSYLIENLPFPKKILIRNSQKCPVQSPSVVETILGDLSNQMAVSQFVHQCPVLLHLACHSNPRLSSGRLVADLEENLVPTIQLFESYSENNPNGHIIFASTGGNMYDDLPYSQPKSEEELPKPRSGYAVHKLAAEHYLRIISEKYGVSATILRISNPYGAMVDHTRAQGLIGVTFARLITNHPLVVYDSKNTLRDYIHLEDVSRFICLLLKSPLTQGTTIYNVSSGIGLSIEQVINAIENVTQRKLKIIFTPESTTMAPSWSVLSYEKAKRELGWCPSISFNDGLKKMLQLSETFQHL
ncbi:MAG: NAD-dependent epimerase/dehydratase family protein [Parachlamydiaceae bacterium]